MSVPGKLAVCATPIGNLGDVTLRVLEALRAADRVLAEDTRVTAKLLARYDVPAHLERYDEFVAARKTPEFVARMVSGESFALVSDAGTPGVSDPGATLVDAALDAGIGVEVLPGPSAILTALVASGLPTHAFYFGGFLPRKAGDRMRLLDSVAALDATLVFYESPRRTAASLQALAARFPDRRGAMARELTKLHEEVARGLLGELHEDIAGRASLKGEVVLLVGPPAASEKGSAMVPADHAEVKRLVDEEVARGLSRADAIKQVASSTGLPRKAVYEIAHRG